MRPIGVAAPTMNNLEIRSPSPRPLIAIDPTVWTDLELRDRMLLRDRLAWLEFHRRFDRLVVRCIQKVAFRFRGQIGEEDAREMKAQFLLDLTSRDMHRLRAYAPDRGSKLGTWIGMIATNTAWDFVRAVSRQPVASRIDVEVAVDAGDEDPVDRIERKQRWARIDEVLRALSIRDRDFVRLYYVDGLSPEAIAATMSISVKTVYSKKHKITARLEQELADLRISA